MQTLGIVVGSIVGFIAVFFVFLYASSAGMRRASMRFLAAVRERRYTDAHAQMTEDFKRTCSAPEFERFLSERGIFRVKEVHRYHGDFWIGSNRGGLKPWLMREDGAHFQIELQMLKQAGSWRVAAIDAQVRLVHPPMPAAANEQTLDKSITHHQ